jgi:acid phosphatase type 7
LPAGSNIIRVTASGTGTGHNAFLDVASFPADGGGGTPSQAACADGVDNDGDLKTDFGGTNGDPGCLSATDNDETDPAGGTDPVFVGAGDIASCASTGDEATAKLLDDIVAKAPSTTTVFTAGDDAYESGTATEFTNCYNPTWGRHQAITRPTVGNHEYYSTANASGYFGYFGSILSAAGDTGQGYYSYDLGSWHMIALNSNCSFVACAAGSAQEQWLKADLAAHSNACTLAYWHHPRFSSKLSSGGNSSMKPFWDALYAAPNKAEVVLNGHIHNYERFAPQTPSGLADPAQGIREFVVGTGGKSLNTFTNKGVANSQVRLANAYGVLKLTLHPSSYDWQFVTAPGGTVADSGSGSCHS